MRDPNHMAERAAAGPVGEAITAKGTVEPSTAHVFGHPIHPMLIPVPIGLWVGAIGTDLGYLLSGDRRWAWASRWLLRGAMASGLVAAGPGLVDFATVPGARRPAGWVHALGNLTAILTTIPNLALRTERREGVPRAALGLSLLTGAILAVTGWLGGELSYRHGVGVLPDDER